MILRQTNYNSETAKEKLTQHSNDVSKVIREYFQPNGPQVAYPPPPALSTNQQIYKQIRGMMDDASKNYELKKQAQAQQQQAQQLAQAQQQQLPTVQLAQAQQQQLPTVQLPTVPISN